jgi:hypothetical protein
MSKNQIRVDYWMKPIPLRRFDYIAMYANDDGDSGVYGEGATEAAAVLDLIENHPRPEHPACPACGENW